MKENMFSIEGKTAFITGGYQGIGLATVERFVKAGAKVVFVDIKDGSEIASSLGAHFIHTDVAEEEGVVKALEEAHKLIGKLDIVINNAALEIGYGTIEEIDSKILMQLTGANHLGPIWVMKHAPRFMNDGGSIINNGSFATQIGFTGHSGYTSAKSAMESMTKVGAIELGERGIRVNTVCPGYIQTSMGVTEEQMAGATKNVETFTPLKRWGQPEEVANLFHYLASDESSYVTGSIIMIDGGWMAGPSKQLWEVVRGS